MRGAAAQGGGLLEALKRCAAEERAGNAGQQEEKEEEEEEEEEGALSDTYDAACVDDDQSLLQTRCESQQPAVARASPTAQGGRPGNVAPPSLAPKLLDLGWGLLGLAAQDALARAGRVLQASPEAAAQMVGCSVGLARPGSNVHMWGWGGEGVRMVQVCVLVRMGVGLGMGVAWRGMGACARVCVCHAC